MPKPDLAYMLGLPPEAAIAYLEGKGYAIGWSWRDVWQEAHAKAFTVAGVTKMDVLADVKAGLVDALKNGETPQTFARKLAPLLERKGWWGKAAQVDPETGEMTGKGLTPRRLATIFDTNMQGAYMAGRYKAFMSNASDRPYWQYVAVMDRRTRPAHAALNGRVFRFDDPLWGSTFPPNGYRCRCSVRALDSQDMQARDIDLSTSEGRLSDIEVPTSRKPDAPTATVTRFEYAPGKHFAPDPGFNFNAGRVSFQPELDRYQPKVASAYVHGELTGPAFAQWYRGVEQRVGAGLASGQTLADLRSAIAVGQRYPVAGLGAEGRQLLGAKTQTVWLSDDTLVKQLVSREGQGIGLESYWRVQPTIEAAQLVIRDGDTSLVFVRRDGRMYHAVVKATKSGEALFLTSFRLSSEKAARQAMKRGEVVRNALDM